MIQSVRQLQLGNLGGKEITGTFNKGDISTDGGAFLVERAERKVGIVDRFSTAITDRRDQTKVVHSIADMLRQRVFAIACAYEDCNDFDELAADGVLKCAVGRLPETDPDLASQPTLSRLENSVTATELYRMSEAFVDVFVEGQDEAPEQIIIDVDATEDPVHGQQQFAAFHGYYGAKPWSLQTAQTST
ncbi:MAG: transposase [Armatimonadota bacterium]